jgi:endonuclease YncB( thermonuclease family)
MASFLVRCRLALIAGFIVLTACQPEPSSSAPAVVVSSTVVSTTSVPAAIVPATTVPVATIAPTTTVAATTTTAPSTTVAPLAPAAAALTAEVVDGDTIAMSDGSRVRLIGIDTPERGQCGSDEASALMASLITGKNITLVLGARDDVDRYGRLLRYVEVSGVDVDLTMIESGRAIARYDGRDGYGEHPRQAAYVAADEASPSINECPTVQPVPVAVPAPIPVPVPVAAPAPAPVPTAVYYKNCDAVRAAGAAPIRAGDPGWQTKFDRDGDGVGCE